MPADGAAGTLHWNSIPQRQGALITVLMAVQNQLDAVLLQYRSQKCPGQSEL